MSEKPPRYVAIAHATRLGEVEQVNLCDNVKLQTHLLYLVSLPKWLMDRVALMRFCPVRQYIHSVRGRKYTDYMIGLYLTSDEYKKLFILRIER